MMNTPQSFLTMLLNDLPLNLTLPLREVHLIEYVCILEHALLQRDDDELGLWEALAYHVADVLGVGEVEG